MTYLLKVRAINRAKQFFDKFLVFYWIFGKSQFDFLHRNDLAFSEHTYIYCIWLTSVRLARTNRMSVLLHWMKFQRQFGGKKFLFFSKIFPSMCFETFYYNWTVYSVVNFWPNIEEFSDSFYERKFSWGERRKASSVFVYLLFSLFIYIVNFVIYIFITLLLAFHLHKLFLINFKLFLLLFCLKLSLN